MPRMVKAKSAAKKARAKTTVKTATKTIAKKAKAKPAAKSVKTKKPAKSAAKATSKSTAKAVVKSAVKTTKPQKATLAVGAAAPAFAMPATVVGKVSAAELKGKPYVVYFYPKDDTPGCTAQACGFRDAVPSFGKLGLTVVGVSRDNIASHEKFAKKFDLTFPLASDETGEVCEAFGTWVEKSMYGRKYMGIERSTFLVDKNGVIRAAWRKVNVPGHVDEVKKAIANL